jgi:pilus assembly protein CpaB
MRNRIFAVVAIAILAGGGLAYGTYNLMQQTGGTTQVVNAPTQPVVVAATDLQLGAALKKEDLTVIGFPEGSAPAGSFAKVEEVIDRGLIVPVVKNEPILNGKLAPKEAGAGLPPVIPEGMRAVSVRVNEVVGVAGYVLPGTRVDVVATASPTSNAEQTTSKVVLSNIQVLTAGTRMEQDQKDGQPMQVTVVTLLVSPEQSERLALASTEGKIQLALRNPLDKGAPDTPGIRTAGLLGSRGSSDTSLARASASVSRKPRTTPQPETAPMAAPPAPTVEIIRGDKRSVEIIK